jgi:hypothetical protein
MSKDTVVVQIHDLTGNPNTLKTVAVPKMPKPVAASTPTTAVKLKQ